MAEAFDLPPKGVIPQPDCPRQSMNKLAGAESPSLSITNLAFLSNALVIANIDENNIFAGLSCDKAKINCDGNTLWGRTCSQAFIFANILVLLC